MLINEPSQQIPKAKPIASSTDKGKGKVVEEADPDSSDEEEVYKSLPQEYWPKEKLLEYDSLYALKLALEDT